MKSSTQNRLCNTRVQQPDLEKNSPSNLAVDDHGTSMTHLKSKPLLKYCPQNVGNIWTQNNLEIKLLICRVNIFVVS